MPELLFEILSEEIPARMQGQAAADLKRLVTDGLREAGLGFETAHSYVTPRRLTLVVDGLPDSTPDTSEERRGPRTDAPEKAIQGFLGSMGLTLDGVEKRETDKGQFYFAVIEKKGQKTETVQQKEQTEGIKGGKTEDQASTRGNSVAQITSEGKTVAQALYGQPFPLPHRFS